MKNVCRNQNKMYICVTKANNMTTTKSYQLFQNGQPYAYGANNTLEDAVSDLKAEYDICARSSSTESISDIADNCFTVETASGKSYTYTIEEV